MRTRWFVVLVVGCLFLVISGPAAGQQSPVKDLPLIEIIAAKPSHTIAVFLSGDGGWAAIDRAIAGALQKKGVSVVGINSLKYFWRTFTPEGASADLARVIRYYRATWYADTVIVIGLSSNFPARNLNLFSNTTTSATLPFGATILP